MRAVIFRQQGPPSVLTIVHDHPKPVRKAGEVLVEVHATSVNPVDYKTRKGEIPLPRLLGALPKVGSVGMISPRSASSHASSSAHKAAPL